MTPEQAKELLRKYRLGLCTPEEEQAIIKWADNLGATPHAAFTKEEQAVFSELLDKRISELTGVNMHPRLEPAMVVELVERPRQNKRLWVRWVAAASVILIIATASFLYLNNKKSDQQLAEHTGAGILPGHDGAILTLADGQKILLDSLGNGRIAEQGKTTVLVNNGQLVYDVAGENKEVLYNTMSTPKGRQYRLLLPDGTKVWLNAASSITYPAAFAGNERTVTIHGEAYFEVAKDKSRPFRVNVNGRSEIEVLGTHFNVNAYDDEETIKTTLLEGSIRLTRNAERVTLKPAQQAVSSIHSPLTIDRSPDLDQVMAWKEGYFNFDNASIQSVMKQIARWYDVEVVYEGAVPTDRLLGELPMDARIEQVLQALQEIEVHFRIEGRKIIVTKQ
jgi:transmembrane sensor